MTASEGARNDNLLLSLRGIPPSVIARSVFFLSLRGALATKQSQSEIPRFRSEQGLPRLRLAMTTW